MIWIQLEDFRNELPSPDNSLALEIVAEAEVAQHLEESVVNGVSNLVNIISAKAFLARSNAPTGWYPIAYEVRLELHHTGRREIKRRIIGHQRIARVYEMTFALKKLKVFGSEFVT